MKVVFAFGRMNPPTIGHEKLVDKIKSVASQHGAVPRLYLSHTQNTKKDPLPYESKIDYARSAFGKMVTSSNSKNLIGVLQGLEAEGVTYAALVCGSDRVVEFRRMLNDYNGRDFTITKLEVISAGERDPDADDVTGMSASKMRALAITGKQEEFFRGAPSGLSMIRKKKMYNEIRKNMKASIREDINLDEAFEEEFDDIKETTMDINEEFNLLIEEELNVNAQELKDFLESANLEDLDPSEDDAYLLDIISPEAVEGEETDGDNHEELGEARVLSIPQRLKLAQRMRRLARRYAMLRKMKSKRMAPADRLRYRARKAALMVIRKRVAGRQGKDYSSLPKQQRLTIDQMVARRFGKKLGKRVGMFATRMLPMIRKKEVERLARARGGKSPTQSHANIMAEYDPTLEEGNVPGKDPLVKIKNLPIHAKGDVHKPEDGDDPHHLTDISARRKTYVKRFESVVHEARKSASSDQGDEGDSNIIYQLRKVINLRGNYDIKWRDGSKSRMTPAEASAAIAKFTEVIRTPGKSGREKQLFVLKLGKNQKMFNATLANVGKKVAAESLDYPAAVETTAAANATPDDPSGSRWSPKLDTLLRLGLVDIAKINQYRQALRTGDRALANPMLRIRLMDILDRLMDISTSDPQMYNRLRATVKEDFGISISDKIDIDNYDILRETVGSEEIEVEITEADMGVLKKKQSNERDAMSVRQARERANMIAQRARTKTLNNGKILENLIRKSEKTGISLDTIVEVFCRGYDENVSYKEAFERVNSFIAGGAAREIDADLVEDMQCQHSGEHPFRVRVKGRCRVSGKKDVHYYHIHAKSHDSAHKKAASHYAYRWSDVKTKVVPHVAMENNESVQVDELSKNTLTSYVKKASDDAVSRSASIVAANGAHLRRLHKTTARGLRPTSAELERHKTLQAARRGKLLNRSLNISKAVHKINKEETEHPNCGTPECCGQCDTVTEAKKHPHVGRKFTHFSGKTGVITSVRKEPTFSQMVPHIRVYGVKYSDDSTDSVKRSQIRIMKEDVKSADIKVVPMKLPDGRIVMKKQKKDIRVEEKETPLKKLKKFDQLRAGLGKKPIFKDNEKKKDCKDE